MVKLKNIKNQREHADEALQKAHDELEMRVQERTAELAEANYALQARLKERKDSIQSKNNLYQLVVFSIDELRYALPLPAIERIVRVVEITPLPKAPDIVLGVVDVQGQIIPVINIRSRFGLPEREMNLNDQLVIARASEQSVALLVNAVSGVVECPEEEVVTVEEIIPGTEYVTGIIKRDEGMILVLDLDTILSFEEVKSLGKAMKKTQRGKK